MADLKSAKFSKTLIPLFSNASIPHPQVVSSGYLWEVAEALSGSGVHDGDLLAKAHGDSVWALPFSFHHAHPLAKALTFPFHHAHPLAKALSGSGVHDGDLLAKAHGDSVWAIHHAHPPAEALSGSGVHDGDLLAKAHGDSVWALPFLGDFSISLWTPPLGDWLVQAHSASLWAPLFPELLAKASLRAGPLLATTLSNQGESSGSGGGAGEERNGGGGDGNQGIGGGVGGGGHREGSGTEQRGSRGRSHGGGSGDDDDNDHGGQFGYILNEGRQGPVRMAEILLSFNFQVFATVESFDITGLSVRVRSVRVVSLGFTSVALVCLSACIRQRGTNPRLASVLSWIGYVATLLGFISMITMALLASFIP